MVQDATKVFCHRHCAQADAVVSSGGGLDIGNRLRCPCHRLHRCDIPGDGDHVEVTDRVQACQVANVPSRSHCRTFDHAERRLARDNLGGMTGEEVGQVVKVERVQTGRLGDCLGHVEFGHGGRHIDHLHVLRDRVAGSIEKAIKEPLLGDIFY